MNSDSSDQVGELRKVVCLVTLAMIVFCGAFTLFLYRQNRLAGGELAMRERQLAIAVTEFKKNKEPLTREFISRLQSYSQSYPDFQPILKRHEALVRQFTAAPTPSATPPSRP